MTEERERVESRKAPYAPIGALHSFVNGIRNTKPPAKIDVAYLRSRRLAPGNEWAFISALKFLGIIDGQGRPTTAFRGLQGSQEGVQERLRDLVLEAYRPLFQSGAATMTKSRLRSWFAVHSSASQAANAARFFRELCDLGGIPLEPATEGRESVAGGQAIEAGDSRPRGESPLRTKERYQAMHALLSKAPSYEAWKGTPEEYISVIETFRRMAEML